MAEKSHVILRSAREAHGWSRVQLVAELGISEDTLKRWEYGEVKPTPDDVANVERVLRAEAEMLWYRWMSAAWDSYKDHHPEVRRKDLLQSVVSTKHELTDVLNLQEKVESAILNGTINQPGVRDRYRKELEEAQASIVETLGQIPKA